MAEVTATRSAVAIAGGWISNAFDAGLPKGSWDLLDTKLGRARAKLAAKVRAILACQFGPDREAATLCSMRGSWLSAVLTLGQGVVTLDDRPRSLRVA
jgi:hypothetical protein